MVYGVQRKRRDIARALVKSAPRLILDEATYALDTESDRYIQAALGNLMKNRTTACIILTFYPYKIKKLHNFGAHFCGEKHKQHRTGVHPFQLPPTQIKKKKTFQN